MQTIQTWGEMLSQAFFNIGSASIEFIFKQLLPAIIILAIGWFIAEIIGKIVNQIIRAIKVDKALEKLNLSQSLEKAGLKLDSGKFLGEIVKWFVILVFLMVAVEIVGLSQITSFLRDIVSYLPRVIISIVWLLAGILIAGVLQKVVKATVEVAGLRSSTILGELTKWSVLIFALFSALIELGIDTAGILFTGLIISIALAFGLAFGLAGKDVAAEFLQRIKKDISK